MWFSKKKKLSLLPAPDQLQNKTEADTNTSNSNNMEENDTIIYTDEDEIQSEFDYLHRLIKYRVESYFHPERRIGGPPDIFKIKKWHLPIIKFIMQHRLSAEEATILLIGIVPHVRPNLFDEAIESKMTTQDPQKPPVVFAQIGGVRGNNSRFFIPTGETVLFLLAFDDLEKRLEIQQLFGAEHLFWEKKILWLEDLPHGEPIMSGKIIIAPDYVGLFLFGTAATPHFSTSFPAKSLKTSLKSKDIMMTDEIKRHYRTLKEWIAYNDTLMEDWQMKKRLRQGYRVLFYGPPGTGKTLTASVLGNETAKDVYKIDLSMVISKYIGETEKNLELLFARAQDKNWILFFDEADAIFGKRTSVKDAHDKYANQEVSYLLQRIEEFNGLVILATNMKNNIDDAFIRRFNDIVKFTMPTEEERKEIWEKSFPEDADYGDIANKVKKYEISGANIINAIHFAGIQALKKKALQEASMASVDSNLNHDADISVENDDVLVFYLSDVLEGIRKEMIKEGKPFTI